MVINILVAVDSGAPCRRAVRMWAPRLATGVLCEVKIDDVFRLCLVESTTDQLVDVVRINCSTAEAPKQSPVTRMAGAISWRRCLDMARLFAKNVGATRGLTG